MPRSVNVVSYAEIGSQKSEYYYYYSVLQMRKLSFKRMKQLDPGPTGSQWQSQDLNWGLANCRSCSFPIILDDSDWVSLLD